MVTTRSRGRRSSRAIACLVAICGVRGTVVAAPATPDLKPLVDAVARQGCAADPNYRTIGGVRCGGPAGGDAPEAVLAAVGGKLKEAALALSQQTRSEDAACARDAGGVLATAHVGARTIDELARGLVEGAIKDALSPAGPALVPAGMVLAIPGVTQVQYNYRGLAHGPELRTFRITGQVAGAVDSAKLSLKLDGDVEGDKNLYVEYEVNYQKTRQPFPAWSPFLDRPGEIVRAFVRQGLNTLSDTVEFSETGTNRNGVKVWHDYHYAWHAEKIGAGPDDIVRLGADMVDDASRHPFGGDWVGSGWGVETRFKSTRKDFVGQFSRGAASALDRAAADAVMMSLNVKHHVVFHFHVDYDGNVRGRGVIVYTLDPDLCGVAVLTRQVNESINLLKYIPAIYLAATLLGQQSVNRWEAAWVPESKGITQEVNELISTLPPKIEASAGARDAEAFIARFPKLKRRNPAFADVNVTGFPKGRLWSVSGQESYATIKELVPLPKTRRFVAREWAKTFERIEETGGFDSRLLLDAKGEVRKPYMRDFDAEDVLIEYLAEVIPRGATGTIRIYSRRPFCPSCTGVIEQAYFFFKGITLLVTSGP
jgi:hypothetical protein